MQICFNGKPADHILYTIMKEHMRLLSLMMEEAIFNHISFRFLVCDKWFCDAKERKR